MFKRRIEALFAEWKRTPNHKPLVIKGCRQCGKTYSVLAFAKANYKHVIYLDFFKHPEYKSAFSGSLDVDVITRQTCCQKSAYVGLSPYHSRTTPLP